MHTRPSDWDLAPGKEWHSAAHVCRIGTKERGYCAVGVGQMSINFHSFFSLNFSHAMVDKCPFGIPEAQSDGVDARIWVSPQNNILENCACSSSRKKMLLECPIENNLYTKRPKNKNYSLMFAGTLHHSNMPPCGQ